MSDNNIKCTRYNSKYFNFEGDRTLYKNVTVVNGGKWLTGTGWVIRYSEKDAFISSCKLAFPNLTLTFVEDTKSEPKSKSKSEPKSKPEPEPEPEPEAEPEGNDDFVPNKEPSEAAIRTVFRSRSADKHRSRVRHIPKDTILDNTEFQLSSSDEDESESDSDSSADFPVRSPGRKKYVSSSAIKRVEHANRRLAELSLKKD